MRRPPGRVGQDSPESPLVFSIVGAIGLDRIVGALVFVGHCLGRGSPRFEGELLRRVGDEPIEMLLTAVGFVLAEPVLEFRAQGHSQLTEPEIVDEALTGPNCAGVLLVLDREVTTLGGGAEDKGGCLEVGLGVDRCGEDPVCCV